MAFGGSLRRTTWVELSQENLPLAGAELAGAAASLEGTAGPEDDELPGLVRVEGGAEIASALARRLALARRCLVELPSRTETELAAWFRAEGHAGRSARLRPLHGLRQPVVQPEVLGFARAYVEGGGRIDLEAPDRRFWYAPSATGWRVLEELEAIDRRAFERRRMPTFPFQRPVSLPPRLARAAANLARVRPGDRVIDPFCGTGALLLEAALLGAKCSGVDRDARMARGALRNFAHLGQTAESVRIGDAAEAFAPADAALWDAVLTDPPYGRQSGSGGEDPYELVRRCLPAWTPFVRPGGVAVVVAPGGPPSLEVGWHEIARLPDRVHRSLTREFRVYERRPTVTGS